MCSVSDTLCKSGLFDSLCNTHTQSQHAVTKSTSRFQCQVLHCWKITKEITFQIIIFYMAAVHRKTLTTDSKLTNLKDLKRFQVCGKNNLMFRNVLFFNTTYISIFNIRRINMTKHIFPWVLSQGFHMKTVCVCVCLQIHTCQRSSLCVYKSTFVSLFSNKTQSRPWVSKVMSQGFWGRASVSVGVKHPSDPSSTANIWMEGNL